MEKKDFLFHLYIGFIGITAFFLVLWITPFGAGVSPDSTIYIGAAKNILSQKGFYANGHPITHYPPLYPFFLAAASIFENDLIQAARFLNAILFSINIGLVSLAVYLATDRNFIYASLAGLFFISTAPILNLYAWALSEPLFLTFFLIHIILLVKFVKRPTLSLFVASSISLGFAIVTRYIGIAFLPSALVILFLGRRDLQLNQRFRDMLIWLIIACTPLGIFLIRNSMVARSATNRSIVFHPVSASHYLEQLNTILLNFIAPIPIFNKMMFTLLILLIMFLILQLIKNFDSLKEITWKSTGMTMSVSCFLFSVSYLLFLFVSISLFDAATPVNTRLISPIFITFIIGVFSAIWSLANTLEKPIIWWSFIIFIALSIANKIPVTIWSVFDIQQNGLGYTSRLWKDSESIAFLRMLDDDIRLYSNGADVLGFLDEKESLSFPKKVSSSTRIVNHRYDEELEAMCNDLKERRALLVYFHQIDWRWYLPTQVELEVACDMPVLKHFKDGTVYGERHK